MIARPKAILFDWDNTLIDSWPMIYEALVKVFEHMGHEPWSLAETKSKVHQSMRDAFPKLFGERWNEAAHIYQSYFRANHIQCLTPMKDVKKTLELCNHYEIFTAVVSNKTGEHLRKEVTHLQWDRFFEAVVGATDAAKDKPAKEPVQMALEKSSIKAGEEIWFIGDSITDMQCAHHTKCVPILFGFEQKESVEQAGYPPKYSVGSHQELMDLLELTRA